MTNEDSNTVATIPSTPEDLFKMYLDRKVPDLPKNIGVEVDRVSYNELQHIKDCISKSYSVRIPTSNLNVETIVGINEIETRHIKIISDIIDMFKLRDPTLTISRKL